MHYFDFRITCEIRLIQRKNLRNSMNVHRCGQPCIVNLNSTDIVTDY